MADRTKALKKQFSRKAKASVQTLAKGTGANRIDDIDEMRNAALTVGYRAGLVWCGDLAVALSALDVGKGGRALVDQPLALELVAWSVSDDFLKLREKLAIALKGTR